jgi:hypothetical protein
LLNNTVAHIQGSCGSGCAKSIIFVAPATVISCAYHDYRIENLDPKNPPDYSSNRPLLIDVKRKIYVCYDNEGNIQTFPLFSNKTIRPPAEYFSEKAHIHHHKLIIHYENQQGKTKQISYPRIAK